MVARFENVLDMSAGLHRSSDRKKAYQLLELLAPSAVCAGDGECLLAEASGCTDRCYILPTDRAPPATSMGWDICLGMHPEEKNGGPNHLVQTTFRRPPALHPLNHPFTDRQHHYAGRRGVRVG